MAARRVAEAATDYLAAATSEAWFEVSREEGVAGLVTAAEMGSVYTRHLVAKGSPGRFVYDRLLEAPPHGICPFCGQRTVSTLDHYLPKAYFSPLVVAPLNLVPACSDCNKAKSDFSPSCAEDQHPHPYFDNFDDECWLVARVIEDRPPGLAFSCATPDSWSAVKAARIKHHFGTLNLGALYGAHAAEELVNLRGSLQLIYPREGDEGVRNHLWTVAEGRRAAHMNSWQTAMYTALCLSDWYCAGGFDF